MILGLALSAVLDRVIAFYSFLIFAWVVLSWFPAREGLVADAYRALGTIVEPYVNLFRRFIPVAAMGGAGLDFSPIVALLALWVVRSLIVNVLVSAGL